MVEAIQCNSAGQVLHEDISLPTSARKPCAFDKLAILYPGT